jgi:aspartyl-tRNA(Asn)/glutamyl-tRNA(Gln) amidotransferase subunit B
MVHKKNIGITRAHLEEDAGKNTHHGSESHVDLNRAGTPLLEIVSEPDIKNSDEAVSYLKKLHSIVRYLDISDANMQEGSFRCDVNISIRPKGDKNLYTRVEIKNMNSFKFIQKAIAYEFNRQCEAWEDGVYDKEVLQETRLFNVDSGETRSMRGKEDSAEYRYFPDPDLLPVVLSEEMYQEGKNIPELPDAKKDRYVREYGIKEYDALIITSSVSMAKFYEDMLKDGADAKLSANWLTIELQGRLSGESSLEDSKVSVKTLSTLVKRISDSTISGKAAKDVLDELVSHGGSVDDTIDRLGLKQVSDDSLIEAIIDEVLTKNQDKVAEYKSGKEKLFGFFVGQVMKASRGSANPVKVNELLKRKIG